MSKIQYLVVPCSQCGAPIDPNKPGTRLAMIQQLVRLRCPHKECHCIDWYGEDEITGGETAPLGNPIPEATMAWYDGLTMRGL